ncbi:3'-5' exonuclease [Frigoribacterium sp. RIT-PI-h]|uniref:3'-5' exonuclease n=1 Tax=Frigoribacterium sp. RIT-PI-h TaxID=1690245 RepID=UPI0009E70A9A|nr:3'-5' exonuclease [Frigoribacterium sp. RIT-PI-h]
MALSSTSSRPSSTLAAISALHVHSLRWAEVKDAPAIDAIADEFIEHLRGRVLVAHNARFETALPCAELERLGITSPADNADVLCTMKLAKTHLPGAGTKLADDCSALRISLEDPHEAPADARTKALQLGEHRSAGRQNAAWCRDHPSRAAGANGPKRRRVPDAEWVPQSRSAPATRQSTLAGPSTEKQINATRARGTPRTVRREIGSRRA